MPTTANAYHLTVALQRFQQLVDPEFVDALRPTRANAVYTAWATVWLMVYQRLNSNATLDQAVDEFIYLAQFLSTNKRVRELTLSANSGSYSRARTRLPVEAAQAVADHVFDKILETTPPSWSGHRVFLLDGTTVPLTSRDNLRTAYPAGSNQHGPGIWPIVQLVVAHELASGAVVRAESGAMYGPEADSEQSLAVQLLKRIPARSLLMADRNFGVFAFVFAAKLAGHDTLTRLTEKRFQALKRSAEEVGSGRWVLEWTPTRADRRTNPDLPAEASVKVWLHEFVGFSGKTLWVATTCDADTSVLADLYARRADVETDIRQLKQTLDCESMRGQSEEMIQKELAMAMVAYNLVVQVRRIAAERAKVPPRRLSFTGVWSLVTTVLLRAHEDWTAQEWQANFEWVLRGAGQRKIPNRPRRSYPREKLIKRSRHPERRPDQEKNEIK